MNSVKAFNELIEKTATIALATSANNIPNVRAVNFCYDVTRPGIMYFTSVRGNSKTVEFEKNNKVAFTTIPTEGNAHIRSKDAMVQKSKFSMDEVKDLFLTQIPDYDEALSQIGELLEVYEIHIKEAAIILDIHQKGSITF
ncbi:UNVERIFIED_CONTAM: putative pyridoxamine 5'-phosphate oxidase family protein [Paenibacillus sp. PvR008]